MEHSDASIARVRAAILDYLAQNRNAADTLEGIVNWWLPLEQRRIDRGKIESALDQLVSDGLVKATSLVDGTVLYSRPTCPQHTQPKS